MADKRQLARLKRGVDVWNKWRDKNSDVDIDLREANLSVDELALTGHITISSSDGMHSILGDLRGANLSGACLANTNLSGTNLSGANLSKADLRGTIISGANLTDLTLSEAIVGYTFFGDNDPSQVKGLEPIEHQGPSSIGIDTIYKSKGNIPEIFLRRCGVPEDMIAYVRSIRGKAINFYSCFISQSEKDKSFCERLLADLQAKGVRTWYFPEDAIVGATVWGEIDRGIKIYDKLVIVLSENSLNSKPVLREIQRSLDREDKEHKNILFPIAIDRYVFDQWDHERKADVMEKVVGDFVGWDKDADKYHKAFEKLLKGLQASDNNAK